MQTGTMEVQFVGMTRIHLNLRNIVEEVKRTELLVCKWELVRMQIVAEMKVSIVSSVLARLQILQEMVAVAKIN